MSSNRSNKRSSSSKDYAHDDDFEDTKPPAKSSKKKAKTKNSDVEDSTNSTPLPLDALLVVMEFLHPRDLLNTASTCKWLQKAVTTKMVVKSALIHGGLAKKSMEELYALMSNHSLHVPSPLRLLRISNGKCCEFCLKDKVNHIRPGIGVFACWDCVTNNVGGRGSLTKVWKTTWSRRHKPASNSAKYTTIFNHPRVGAKAYGRNYYLWSQHRTDLSGERIGSIVTWGDIDQMCNHFTNAEAMTGEEGLDHYLATNLNALPIDRYSEFNDTFTTMKAKADAAVIEREQNKKAKKETTKQKKKASVETILADLTLLIDESFREVAMQSGENASFNRESAKMSDTPSYRMETAFIDTLLRPYILTPSKMKKSTMKEIAATINEKLRLITNKNLLSMDFLSDTDPFEKSLKQHIREKLPDMQTLFSIKRSSWSNENQITDTFISCLEGDNLLGAVGFVLEHDIGQVLLNVEGSPAASAAQEAASSYEDDTLSVLAKQVWSECLGRYFPPEKLKEIMKHYVQAFEASQKMFVDLLYKLNEYYDWLLEKHKSEERSAFQRKNAASNLYFDMIGKRDFEALDERQRWAWERHERSRQG